MKAGGVLGGPKDTNQERSEYLEYYQAASRTLISLMDANSLSLDHVSSYPMTFKNAFLHACSASEVVQA